MGRAIENLYLNILKQDLSLEEAKRNMYSNENYMWGFLGRDENLQELIESDKLAIEKLGISYEQIASAVEDLFLSDEERVNGNFILRKEYIASPICPWKDYCTTSPFTGLATTITEIVVVNESKVGEAVEVWEREHGLPLNSYQELVDKDLAMVFSDLHPHLIRDHHFFEGKATPYRVDPERAIRYLGIH